MEITPTPNTMSHKMRKNLRGVIQNSEASYLIINELSSTDISKVFSAVKISHDSSNIQEIGNQALCIRYISKEGMQRKVFDALQIPCDKVKKFYSSLSTSFKKYKEIKHDNIQELIDFVEDEEGLYFVIEFCEYSLHDYIQIAREPIKNTKYSFEIKIRKIIIGILDCLSYIHDCGFYLCALLNISDIMVKEVSEYMQKTKYVVKLPHPLLAHLYSLIIMKNSIEDFPSYFAPEIYSIFADGNKIQKALEKKGSFEGLGNVLNSLDQSFDMWAVGYLIYEILYETPPFEFESILRAEEALKSDCTYEIRPYEISFQCLQIINQCLQYDPKNRIQPFGLMNIISEMTKQMEDNNIDDFERILKARINESKKHFSDKSFKSSGKFNIRNNTQFQTFK